MKQLPYNYSSLIGCQENRAREQQPMRVQDALVSARWKYCWVICSDRSIEKDIRRLEMTLARIAFTFTNLPLPFIITLLLVFCSSRIRSISQHSAFDIEIKELTSTYVRADAINIANVELPENTRFLWYFSPTRDPVTWMLKGVGETLSFDFSQAEEEGLLNLTVIYPNGVRESLFRPLRKYFELEVDTFANGILLNRGSSTYKLALDEGDVFVFECLFRGNPMNIKIILPDEMECKDQSLDPGEESISVRCENLHFKNGQYGCEGQSADKKLASTVYLYGNASQSKCPNKWVPVLILLLPVVAWYVLWWLNSDWFPSFYQILCSRIYSLILDMCD